MKKYLLMFVMSVFATLSIAENVSPALSTDVTKVECMPGSAVCDVFISDGRVLNIEHSELTMYLEVVPNVKFSYDSPLFLYNEKDEIVSLNPKTFGKSNAPAQQEQPAPATVSQMPFDIKTGNSIVQITSMHNDLIVNKIIPNRGNCTPFDLKAKRDETNAEAAKNPGFKNASAWHHFHAAGILAFGKQDEWQFPITCNIIELQVETNLGSWTVTFR